MEFLRDNWYVILGVLVGLVVLPYVLGPIFIRMILKQAAEPNLPPFAPDHPNLPREVAEHFRKVTRELAPLGFEPVTGLAMPQQATNVKAVLVMFANRAQKDAAIAVLMYGAPPGGVTTLQTAYVEIVSRFRGGEVVQTNNTAELSAFPERPGYTTGRFPSVKDSARLYRLHQALADRVGDMGGKVMELNEQYRGDAAAYMAAAMVDELEGAAAVGYMYLTPSRSQYRPTWKGAFIMTWQELWPLKSMRRAKRDRQEKALLAELEGQGV